MMITLFPKKTFVLILFVLGLVFSAMGQTNTGTIRGQIQDRDNGEAIVFCKVLLTNISDSTILMCASDIDGFYQFTNVPPGIYDMELHSVGLQHKKELGIMVNAGQITNRNVIMENQAQLLESVEIVHKRVRINKDQACVQKVSAKEIRRVPTVGGTADIVTVAGVTRGKRKLFGKKNKNTNSSYYDPNNNTESYSSIVENDFNEVKDEPLSTFSVDLDAASYSNVRRFLKDGHKPQADAVRIEEMINYFSYRYPKPKDEHPFSITTEVGNCPWNSKTKLVHIGLQGEDIGKKEMPASNLVFLIDVSGSMGAPNKLPLLKQAFRMLVEKLDENDQVAMVVYAGSSGLALPPTMGSDKGKILGALDELSSGGSTAGGEGIELAYKVAMDNFIEGGNNRVILATDGDFNVGQSSDQSMKALIEEKRKSGVFLTCLGFGMGNYKDSKLETLADAGNGNYAYIDNIMEAKKVLVTEMSSTLYTIAKDVKIQIEFNPAIVESYRLVGYENRLLAAEDFDDDTKDAGEIGAGHTVTALYEIVVNDRGREPQIDDLRYGKDAQSPYVDELLTVKFRYKDPDGEKSKLIQNHLKATREEDDKLSKNFWWAAAVAEFGMLLRDSKHKGTASYQHVKTLAKKGKGMDAFGYRSEFIKLVGLADQLVSEVE